jgi:hypothetical protein
MMIGYAPRIERAVDQAAVRQMWAPRRTFAGRSSISPGPAPKEEPFRPLFVPDAA